MQDTVSRDARARDGAGAADAIDTPALVLDLDVFETNVARMAAHAATHGVALRPHAKTHKCAEIARRQLAAGALGVCCAKLAEAEALVARGIDRILLTSPVVRPAAIARLLALHAGTAELLVVVDHPRNVADLAAAAGAARTRLGVLLDLDPGLHRTGVRHGEEAVALARTIAAVEHLAFRGVQMYAGHLMHVGPFAERRERSLAAMAELAAFRRALEGSGIPCEIVTGGGTGTFDIDVEAGVLTELQVGSYAFMDGQYHALEARRGGGLPFATSLFVQTTVVSCNTPRLATTDAGLKAFATDAGPPIVHAGGPADARYFFFGDEHGGLAWRSDARVELGDILRAVTPHCDPTVNLYDRLHVVRGDRVVDVWTIDARGRST
jgi:D-serine deaminase-like pyridoxal phosphate-dependent protein